MPGGQPPRRYYEDLQGWIGESDSRNGAGADMQTVILQATRRGIQFVLERVQGEHGKGHARCSRQGGTDRRNIRRQNTTLQTLADGVQDYFCINLFKSLLAPFRDRVGRKGEGLRVLEIIDEAATSIQKGDSTSGTPRRSPSITVASTLEAVRR